MKRFIDKDLLQWKESARRKPLIVRGARQVGKTYSIKQFGKKEFESLAYIDFESNVNVRRIFEGNLSAKQIIADLEVLLGQRIEAGKTLVFFDEIQACPRAVTSLRYFYEEVPEYHVIATGSLLEFAMKDVSFPVGRIQFLHQFPLTFIEYLSACKKEEAAQELLANKTSDSLAMHEFLLQQLRGYFFVGGMPESVKAYAETGSMQESFSVQAELCDAFRLDFSKYSSQIDKTCLNAVLTSVARSSGQQTKYSKLSDGFSNPTLKKAYDLLCLAGLIRKVPCADPSGIPLGARASGLIFKSLLLDIGLMRFLSGMPSDIEFATPELLSIYRGAMAEQFVGQELAVAKNSELYYWARQEKNSSAEIDFLVVNEGVVVPIEVKSGASGRLKSLHMFLETYKNCGNGLVFSSAIQGKLPEERILFLPLYKAFSASGGKAVL